MLPSAELKIKALVRACAAWCSLLSLFKFNFFPPSLRRAAMTGVLHRLWEQWEHMGTLDSDLDPSKASRAKEPSSEAPRSQTPSTGEKSSRIKLVPGSNTKDINLNADDYDDESNNISNNERVNSDVVGMIGRSIDQKNGDDSLRIINVGQDGLSMSGYIHSIAAITSSVKQGDNKPINTHNNSSGKRNKNTKQQVANEEKTRHFVDILDNVGFTRDCQVTDESNIEPLGIDKTIGAFGVLALGVAVSAVILVLEFWVFLGCCGRIRGWCCGQKNDQNERLRNRKLRRMAWDRSLKSDKKFNVGTFDYPNLFIKEGKMKRKDRKTTPGTLIFVNDWEDKLQL